MGEPLCGECFDHPRAVLWNAHVPRLWVRTSLELYRELAKATKLSTTEVRRLARLSYLKVVEFQRRGLVHLHVVVRADGSAGPSELPPSWLDADLLGTCVRRAVAKASVAFPDAGGWEEERAAWGDELDIRELDHEGAESPAAVAAYVAKYVTKTADGSTWLAHPIRSAAQLEHLDLRPQIFQMVRTSWHLGQHRGLRELSLQAHAHTLGYGGQFSSKSARFSTTFGALRAARANYMKAEPEAEPDYDGEWRYTGRGYSHTEADSLAGALFEASTRARTTLTQPLTTPLTTP